MIKIYSDGACSGNPGPGGWGAIIINESDEIKKLSGYSPNTTNNRMELQAAIEGIKYVANFNTNINLFTDSTYLKDGITQWIKKWQINKWNNGKVKNVDLWKELLLVTQNLTIKWEWVKAHSGEKYNEMADSAAREQIIVNRN